LLIRFIKRVTSIKSKKKTLHHIIRGKNGRLYNYFVLVRVYINGIRVGIV